MNASTCPSWCLLDEGHDFDSVLVSDPEILVRAHEREVGSVAADEVAVSVAVVADDLMGPDGFTMTAPSVFVWIESHLGTRPSLTADQAREVAGLLMAAADEIGRHK